MKVRTKNWALTGLATAGFVAAAALALWADTRAHEHARRRRRARLEVAALA
jgi:hypothetical protein